MAKHHQNPSEKKANKKFGVSPEIQKRKIPLGGNAVGAVGGAGAAGGPATGPGSFTHLVYHGGPVINNPQVYLIFLGDWTSSANQTRATRLGQFISDLMQSSYMNILSQYGCGTTGSLIKSVFIPDATNALLDSDVHTVLQNAIDTATPATQIPEPTAGSSNVYIIYLDDAKSMVDGSIVLCQAASDTAFGYHSSFVTTKGNPLFYAIIPTLNDTCVKNTCAVDANCSLRLAQTQEQRQTQVTSHEFSEMVTNPAVIFSTAWNDDVDLDSTGNPVGEIGDICNGNSGTITVGANTWAVQLMYSKWDDLQTNGATTCVSGESDPLPSLLPEFYFSVNKSSFGKDEATDQSLWPNAFWLVLEGYSISQISGVAPVLSGPFAGNAGVSLNKGTPFTRFENPADLYTPQRISFYYDVLFSSPPANIFPANNTPAIQQLLNASIALQENSMTASTDFELLSGADPYFTNVDPSQGNKYYLSQDLRVFTATPGLFPTPVVGAPAFGPDNIPNAFTYIQTLLGYLNNNFSDVAGADPFNTILPGQTAALTGDSSVTPTTNLIFEKFNNYNFAVARVRLTGDAGIPGQATNVKVFFRLWVTETSDADFQPSTYTSTLVNGLPEAPLPGSDQTIPFFATGNFSANNDYVVSGVNNQTITIDAGKKARWTYFGCFLNLYDPANNINMVNVQNLLKGNHHCLVAEIAYDAAPIINANGVTETPENSDKLAQRNLQVTLSDNPGAPATHRIPQTFDIRPSRILSPVKGQLLDYPDELLIDWGNMPVGSIAHIYWPQVQASDVLKLAAALYTTRQLSAADPNTIQCTITGGTTNVPIPPGAGENFAGLFTIDLPPTVVKGQEFRIVVKRISSRQLSEHILKDNNQVYNNRDENNLNAGQREVFNWRYVIGSFEVRIPVSTKAHILAPEEDLLAIMKWRMLSIPPTNRWYAVMIRYIEYISARVDGLGGNSKNIRPSRFGNILKGGGHGGHDGHGFTGKISGIIFNRFGDFEGFSLRTLEGKEKHFNGRQREMELLVDRAWKQRYLITVFVSESNPDWPAHIEYREAPWQEIER